MMIGNSSTAAGASASVNAPASSPANALPGAAAPAGPAQAFSAPAPAPAAGATVQQGAGVQPSTEKQPKAQAPSADAAAASFVDVLRAMAGAIGVDPEAGAVQGEKAEGTEDEAENADAAEQDAGDAAAAAAGMLMASMTTPVVPVTVMPVVAVAAAESQSPATGDDGAVAPAGSTVAGAAAGPATPSAAAAVASAQAQAPVQAAVQAPGQGQARNPAAFGEQQGAPTAADPDAARGARSNEAAAPPTDAAPARPGREQAAVERLVAAATADATNAQPTTGIARTADNAPSMSDATVKLVASAPSQWRQPLHEALGDRLQLQLRNGSDHAVIRLDPPTLGRIEISVRQEGGGLQVHLSASNGEVLRQLNHIGENMRQELAQRQYGEVTVVVSDSSRGAQGQQHSGQGEEQQDESSPYRALAEAEDGHAASQFALAQERD